jgi:hypothetical protein
MHRRCPLVIAALLVAGAVSNARRSASHGGDRQLAVPAARCGDGGQAEADRRSVHDAGGVAGGSIRARTSAS